MEFVNKQLALKLKEKGFDKPCFGWYHITTPPGAFEGRLQLNESHRMGLNYQHLLSRHINEYSPNPNLVNAPTIEQVLEWLREEKKIYVGIAYMPKIGDNTDFYYPTIQKIGDFEPTHFGDNDDEIFNSYEYAAIAGIEYVIDNLI